MMRTNKRWRKHCITAFAVLAMFAAALPAVAAPGDPDDTFGTNGVVITNQVADEEFEGVATHTDGKTVAVGTLHLTNDEGIIARYNVNGTLDTSFSGDGIVRGFFGYTKVQLADVGLYPDGRIIVGGSAVDGGGSSHFLALRFQPNGALDPTFGGGDGIQETSLNSAPPGDHVEGVAIYSDGRIALGGWSGSGGATDFVAIRLLQSGAPDTSFDTDGIAVIDLGSTAEYAHDVAIDSLGRIVLVGESGSDTGIVRLQEPTGMPDSSFDVDGRVVTDAGGNDVGWGVAIQPNDNPVVVGSSLGPARDLTVIRYQAGSGALDATFAGTGIWTHDFHAFDDVGHGVLVLPSGDLVVAGQTFLSATTSQGFLLRVRPNGTLSGTGFGTGDAMETDLAGALANKLSAVAMTATGQIVAAGQAGVGSPSDLALFRVQPSCTSGYNYIGPDGGDWMVTANWSLTFGVDGDGLPNTPASCVNVFGFRVLLNTNISVGGVSLGSANGAIGGSGTLTVSGNFQWSNGAMLGTGTTRILPGAVLHIDGNPVKLGGCVPASPCTQKRTLDLQGTTQLSGPGAILADDGTHIINTGKFLIGNDGGVVPGLVDADPRVTFVNDGIVRKTGEMTPGVASIIAATFSGGGSVQVDIGALQIWTTGPISGPVEPGQTISTGTTADTTLPGGEVDHRDFATSVENMDTAAAEVDVDESTADIADKGGYGFLPFRTIVEAESAAGIDAEVTVEADSTQLTGDTGTQVWAFDHGTLVPECPDPVTVAPDPCVTRETTAEGDARLVLHTERLGTPEVGPLLPTPLGHARKEPVSADVVISELGPALISVTAAGISPTSSTTVLGTNALFQIDPGHAAIIGDGLGDAGAPLASVTDLIIDPAVLLPAGSYTILDGLEQATLHVKPQLIALQPSKGHDVHVTMSALAPAEYCTDCVFDVQYRLKPAGKKAWGAWKNWGQNEDEAAATYTVAAKGHGTYQGRVRLENTGSGATSGWSPGSGLVKVNK